MVLLRGTNPSRLEYVCPFYDIVDKPFSAGAPLRALPSVPTSSSGLVAAIGSKPYRHYDGARRYDPAAGVEAYDPAGVPSVRAARGSA
jgi:hypothetical protein